MRRLRDFLSLACFAVVAAACEEATQQTLPQTPIGNPPTIAAAPNLSVSWGDTVQIGDDAPPDTSDRTFATDELKAARDTLEARLKRDQFLSTVTTSSRGTGCLNSLVANVSNPEILAVFVRPRVISMRPQDSSWEKTADTEVTRLALIRQDVHGQWRGVVAVMRDVLHWKLQSDGKSGNWAVCELPGRDNGHNSDGSPKPMTAWLPINSANTEVGPKVIWDGDMTWSKLRQLADSVSKAQPEFVGNPEPKMPIYYRDLCPGEGCSFGRWLACDTVRILKEAESGSPMAFMLNRHDTITALTGDVKIHQAGKVVFSRVVKVNMEGTHTIFTPADTLYPLIHTGEGFGGWYFRGKKGGGFFFFGGIVSGDRSTRMGEGYSVVRFAKHEWWVKARNKKGQVGWFIPRGGMPGMAPHYEEGAFACSDAVNGN